MLSQAQIKKFQALYKKQFGKDINEKEALEKGVALLNLMKLVFSPMTQEEYKSLQKRRKATT